jgi:AGCS family alanine or glycine:cation symporter
LGEVLDFSDRLILVLSAPNRFGLYILSEEVRKDLKSYWERLKDGTLQAPAKEEKDS